MNWEHEPLPTAAEIGRQLSRAALAIKNKMNERPNEPAELIASKGIPRSGHKKHAVFFLASSKQFHKTKQPLVMETLDGRSIRVDTVRIAGPTWESVRARLHKLVDSQVDLVEKTE